MGHLHKASLLLCWTLQFSVVVLHLFCPLHVALEGFMVGPYVGNFHVLFKLAESRPWK